MVSIMLLLLLWIITIITINIIFIIVYKFDTIKNNHVEIC